MHPFDVARSAVARWHQGQGQGGTPIETGYINYASGTFDASGNATAVVRVTDSSTVFIERMATSSSSTTQPKLTVYRGDVNAANVVDFTNSGNGDISETNLTLLPGQYLTFQWVGGTVGATATIRVEGKRTLSRRTTI